MKRFTQKFFLLTVGMLLSVGASAQEEIKHRFPQFDFTYTANGQTIHAYVPAWEARSYVSNKHHGAIRFQATKILETKVENGKTLYKFEAKIVSRGGIQRDAMNYADINKDTKISFTDKDGNPQEMKASLVSYGHFVPDTYDDDAWWNSFNYGSNNNKDYLVFDFSASGSYCVDTQDYTIIDSWTGSDKNEYSITKIDDYAFRNLSVSGDSTTYWFRPKSVTIPATIKELGHGAFYSNLLTKKVIFAPDNVITEIPAQCFMNLYRVEEITFSPKVNSIGGAALGGCKLLNKIVFKSTEAPDLKVFTRDGHTYNCITATGTASPTVPSKCIIEIPLHSAKAYADKADEQNNYLFKEFPMSSKFTMDKAYISYCSDLPFTFKQYDTASQEWNDGGMEVYYVQDSDVKLSEGKIDITKITATKIPSEIEEDITPLDSYNSETGFETGYFGVILHGTNADNEDGSYNIFYPNNLPCDEVSPRGNLLQGVIKDAQIEVIEDYLFFVLSKSKFLTVEVPGKLAAHKAFLLYTGDQTMPLGARELSISLPEETGIMNHEVNRVQNDVFYNLQGIQVKQPSKGIFIKNGKKFVIK